MSHMSDKTDRSREDVDFYAVLELPADADDTTIRLAYRRLARRYHPDIAGEESLRRMQALNEAYQTLSDPERRRIYDASRPQPTTSPPPSASAAPPRPPTRAAPRHDDERQRRPATAYRGAGRR